MPNSEYQRGLDAAKQGELVSEELTHSPLPWDFTWFTKPDGSEIKTPQDVADTCAFSSLQCEGTRLWGVTLAEKDKEGRTLVICYTGNGPHSEANARLITAAVNALNITQPAAAIRALIPTQPEELSDAEAQKVADDFGVPVTFGDSTEGPQPGRTLIEQTLRRMQEWTAKFPLKTPASDSDKSVADDLYLEITTLLNTKFAEPATPPTPQPTLDEFAQAIINDVLSGRQREFLLNRTRARINLVIGLDRWQRTGVPVEPPKEAK